MIRLHVGITGTVATAAPSQVHFVPAQVVVTQRTAPRLRHMRGNVEPAPEELSSAESRLWWCALMENVVSLIEDANCLLAAGSYGRGRSLLILASEELGKAVWLYEEAKDPWSGHCDGVALPPSFDQRSRLHLKKLDAAEEYRTRLEGFVTDFWPPPRRDFANSGDNPRVEAMELNLQKQAGFYVDRKNGVVHAPSDVAADGVSDDLERLAFVGLMILIEDDVRRLSSGRPQSHAGNARLQDRLMEFTHPGEFGGFIYQP